MDPSTTPGGPSSSFKTPRTPDPPSAASSSRRILFPGILSLDNDHDDHAGIAHSPDSDSSGEPSRLPYLQRDGDNRDLQDSRRSASAPSVSSDLTSSQWSESILSVPPAASPGLMSPMSSISPTSPPQNESGSGKVPRPRPKRRPSPLNLTPSKDTEQGMGGPSSSRSNIVAEIDDLPTATSVLSDGSNLSNELQDLTLLRQSIKQSLKARPFDSPLIESDSGGSSRIQTPELLPSHRLGPRTIALPDFLTMQLDSDHLLVVDTRPLALFLESHFPRSANISIPSLLFKRFRKGAATSTWQTLGSFISTQAGREVWEQSRVDPELSVVVTGLAVADETAKVLYTLMDGLLPGRVRILQGGWAPVMASKEASSLLVAGEESRATVESGRGFPEPKTAPLVPPPPPIPPSDPLSASLAHQASMPSLRPDGLPDPTRNFPSLSLRGQTHHSTRRQPKLSLNLDKPLRSATIATFPHSDSSQTSLRKKASNLSVNIKEANHSETLKSPSAPMPGSFQALCLAQSKLPPSPSSFGDVRGLIRHDEDDDSPTARSPLPPPTAWSGSTTARPQNASIPIIYPTPATPIVGSASSGMSTARSLSPFVVSTILPGFLYLGPEICTTDDVKVLKNLGVKRVLNVAIECEDDEGLGLPKLFERYLKIPMKDIVEESGVAKGLREANVYLDDARLHSASTYVHCKAGKSRSVTVVLAYLIHANAWTLKTAYAYVAERRKGISPNIGFVAELMQFEESELGLKQSGGVHGEGSGAKGGHEDADEEHPNGTHGKNGPRYGRESLPPAWATSLDSSRPRKVPLRGEEGEDKSPEDGDGRRPVADEREVRKNGQWVHHRRAPFDRMTLQPGRRVSKAGLESLRGLEGNGPRASPHPSPGLHPGDDQKPAAATPGVEGRLGWV